MDSRTVICGVCQRQHHPKRLPFFCVVDARNALYEGRIVNARVLMEKDELEQRLNDLLLGSQPDSAGATPNRDSAVYVENCKSEEVKARDWTEQIISQADELRKNIEEAKKQIEERKANITRRKSDLATVSQGLTARRERQLDETKRSTSRTKFAWDREYDAMTHYRAALCTEVAKLYRLQRVRRGNPVRFEYKIGGIDLVDLHHMNSAQPELISASLAHVAHLLWLTSHYLAIRLPCEITLPHNDYPRPTIFSLQSSYNHGEVPFPGTSQRDLLLSQDPQHRQYQHIPHPRPLFLDKPLAGLKEDALNYNLFIEGVCLLAYNIVWLCRTQGIPVGENSNTFDDFACMGRNLYNLLIGSSLHRAQLVQPPISDANISSPARNDTNANGGEIATELSKATPKMGAYSHGTSHIFLGDAHGQEFTRSFKLPSPVRLFDKLKARLVSQAPPREEWDMIEEDELGPNDLDDGVVVGGTPQSKSKDRRFGLESYMSVNTTQSGSGGVSRKDKEKGTNGWTKIKSR